MTRPTQQETLAQHFLAPPRRAGWRVSLPHARPTHHALTGHDEDDSRCVVLMMRAARATLFHCSRAQNPRTPAPIEQQKNERVCAHARCTRPDFLGPSFDFSQTPPLAPYCMRECAGHRTLGTHLTHDTIWQARARCSFFVAALFVKRERGATERSAPPLSTATTALIFLSGGLRMREAPLFFYSPTPTM